MSVIDKMIRSAARPKSFWAMFALGLFAPLIGLPYILLVNHGFIDHSVYGFLFFLVLIAIGFCLFFYYLAGMAAGKYKDLGGRSWSELPW